MEVKDKLVVEGLGMVDGTYEFSILNMIQIGNDESLTAWEAHEIKRIAGVRAGEILEGLVAGDTDLHIAFGVIVLTRHRKRVDEQQLWNSPLGSVLRFEWKSLDAAIEEFQTKLEDAAAEGENPPAEAAETPQP